MGHDEHFLSRLDRVTRDQVDFALTLYRDHERTAWILSRANVPLDAERIALAIEPGDKSPHVIVTRDGHFVTCLGAEMNTGGWPVLTRGQLDHFSDEYQTGLERIALRARLEEERRGHGTFDNLYTRLFSAGPSLSREEFLACSAFAPLMTPAFAGILVKRLEEYTALAAEVTTVVRRKRSPTPPNGLRPSLVACGRAFWTMQHSFVLYAMNARDALDRVPDVAESVAGLLVGFPAQGALVGSFVRSAWAVAKVGRILLPHCKRQWETAESQIELYSAAAGLAALGVRHQRLQGDVQRALAQPREGLVGEAAKWVGEAALQALDPAFVDAARDGRSVEQVIDESVGRWAVSPISLYESTDHFDVLVRMLPFVARAEPQQLYLPRDLARTQRWDAEDMWKLLAREHEAMRPPTPEGPAGPSRSGPCTCGSGKKYKRCCGADARYVGGAS
jgi:hypothetical protein